jgi:hypothetical protein
VALKRRYRSRCSIRVLSSFSTVVLFLKVLLNQQRLDTPFTGGLGSYKLYVLVAFHIQRHLQLGGCDQPGEVLLSFLFRYGCVRGHNVTDGARTTLRQDVPLQYSASCSADLSNVFQLGHCVHLFRRCWERLWKYVGGGGVWKRDHTKISGGVLMYLIDADQLLRERQDCARKASTAVSESETAARVHAIREKRHLHFDAEPALKRIRVG